MGASIRNSPISMADTMYDQLKEQIINLTIEPGQPLTEESLAKALEVSRTPVREALRMLERDQLVERSHNKGFTVRDVNEQDMLQIFELRAVMEGWAAGQAAKLVSGKNLEVMQACLEEAEALYHTGDFEACDRKSNEIHDIIAFVVNNRWFTKIIEDLSTFATSYKKMASHQEGQIEQALEEHKKVLLALQAHDSKLASQLMIEHINNSQKSIQKALHNRTYHTSGR